MTTALGPRMLWSGTGALARSWRLDVVGEEHVASVRRAGRPVLFAVWHANLMVPLWHRRGEAITLLVSGHRDGQRLAAAAGMWGYDTVFGSSTRGGVRGLRGLIRALRSGRDGAVTPDGPRGPARVVKDGIVVAARSAQAAVVPIGVHGARVWSARSWDRFTVPAIGARVRLVYGEPVLVGREERSAARARLADALAAVQDEAACRS